MSSSNRCTILVVEDELEVRDYLETALKCLGLGCMLVQDGDEALDALKSSRTGIDAVLLDLMMPNRDGLDTLREIRLSDPHLPVIVLSGMSTTFNVVSAMKSGATDFLCKPVTHEELQKSIGRALDHREPIYVSPPQSAALLTDAFTGASPRMQEIQALAGQIGWSDEPVLIHGETGSGKEVLARELHAQSRRAGRPLLKLNCAALPSELVESELFGYERGAFTGAFQKKAGLFELADGGTILLDEIGDMDIRLQAKLLQVLQDHSFQRIGGKETIKVDVRVMAATHRDLEAAIEESTFREDLYYRLNVITLQLPPLRERREDIVALAGFLLDKHAVKGISVPPITRELAAAMLAYHWPGNVRELENCMRRLLILRNSNGLARELEAKAARKPAATAARPEAPPPPEVPSASSPILEQVSQAKQQAETDVITAALNATHWNRKKAAVMLQIDYKALLYKMKKLGIDGKQEMAAAS